MSPAQPQGQTIAEKILSRKSGTTAFAGDIVVAEIDRAMSHDANRPLPLQILEEMGAEKLIDPKRYVLCLDHSAPSPAESIGNVHNLMRVFARENKLRLFEVGEGVCHQLMLEKGLALPGELIIGSDSHTCTYGALNAFATGMGSTDLAMALATGRQWFKVPHTIKIELKGKLPSGVFAKDLILELAGRIGADGATYQALEFRGGGLGGLSVEERFTLSNMAVEMGAKAGLMEADESVMAWLKERGHQNFTPAPADKNAVYRQTEECDLSALTPRISRPHQVDKVSPLTEVEGTPIQQGFIGSCSNGRLSDLRVAARILRGRQVHQRCRLIVCPASRRVLLKALAEGVVQTLVEAGAVLGVPGCGPCGGNHMGVPGDGEVVISSSNRNFKGRMGNRRAEIYLASPAAVAAAAIKGKIADPRRFWE